MTSTPDEQAAMRQGVAEVIRATGFLAMADDYLNKPAYRVRVLQAMRRNIERDTGRAAANRFAKLANDVQRACGEPLAWVLTVS